MGFWGCPYLDFTINLHIQSGNKTRCSIKGGEMDDMWLSPMGLGFFLVCLGGMIYLLSKANEVIRRTKASAKEKELEKKKE
jgi:hypothetical protein